MKRIAILTSGGDAPGMNAAVRSAVRYGIHQKLSVFAVMRGYQGLIEDEIVPFTSRRVSNMMHLGGTILKTARSTEFQTEEGLLKAKANLDKRGIEGLIVIGGDGSFRGAAALAGVWKGGVVGVPATIDNDIWGTDYTIGFDTAVNTAVSAINNIRDTASSHDRIFLVEVMGRHTGFIALHVAVASGAEELVIPEFHADIPLLCHRIQEGFARGKDSSIIIIAEGNPIGNAYVIGEEMKVHCTLPLRVVVLGHLLRGGMPTVGDRILASKLGAHAVEMLLAGKGLVAVGEVRGHLAHHSFADVLSNEKPLDAELFHLSSVLAT